MRELSVNEMENNTVMRELTQEEVQEVNGGNWIRAVQLIVKVASKIDWGEASYEDMMIAP